MILVVRTENTRSKKKIIITIEVQFSNSNVQKISGTPLRKSDISFHLYINIEGKM